MDFFAEVMSLSAISFCSGSFGNEFGYLATLVDPRFGSAAQLYRCAEKAISYHFLLVKRVYPLGSCHVSEQTRAIREPFRFDINAIQHRQQ